MMPTGKPSERIARQTQPRRAQARDVLAALRRPKVVVMLALGFSCGTPFMLIGNTLGYWLREGGMTLSAIGFLSWVGLAYALKPLWAPMLDRLDAPAFGRRLGRRRGWMVWAQLGVAVGLLGMAATGPRAGMTVSALGVLGGFAVLTAFAAASQDIVVDAWRIEIADDADELGLLTGAHQLGYRAALLATESLILILAAHTGWPAAYVVFAAALSVGLVAVACAREPDQADKVMAARAQELPLWTPRGLSDAIIGPFTSFFRTQGGGFAVIVLTTITLYHLSDYVRGPVSNPFYHDLGLSKSVVGLVRATVGLWGSLAGIAMGGVCALRFGYFRTLIVGAILQPIGIAAFAALAVAGPKLNLFSAIMTADAFAIGFSGVALVAYMSSLTSLGYTATQYAVMTSALAWTGKLLKGFSGEVVDQLHAHGRSLLSAYALFYAGAAAIGAPALVLCLVLAAAQTRRAQTARSDPRPAAAPAS